MEIALGVVGPLRIESFYHTVDASSSQTSVAEILLLGYLEILECLLDLIQMADREWTEADTNCGSDSQLNPTTLGLAKTA